MLLVGTMILGAAPVSARIIRTRSFACHPHRSTGGPLDFGARLLAQGISASLGQQVIVDNRGISGIEIVAKAPPDGYTLIYYTGPLWLTPFLRDNARWIREGISRRSH